MLDGRAGLAENASHVGGNSVWMAQLLRLADYRRAKRRVSFSQQELRELLNVYSRRVVTGEWRDYAIDHLTGMAVFSIFRHTCDAPLFRVAKLAGRSGDEYLVVSGMERLKSGRSIREVLSVFEAKRLELVT